MTLTRKHLLVGLFLTRRLSKSLASLQGLISSPVMYTVVLFSAFMQIKLHRLSKILICQVIKGNIVGYL